ncbi:MAG: beta-ureidopropionase [Candidatus Cloacimonetes bacterium HGW-Cloacimonetes-3]|jgi:predicted amidohydrolase|nr:MAG: beta-ureidopropionase [Candidatus Cloacimonetes bacterium HGW-Cloacimonetes-3]
MKVTVLQFQPKLLAVQDNVERLSPMLEGITSDLVVMPELVTSGYVFASLQEVRNVAESVPEGASFTRFAKLAQERNFSLVYGFPENDEGVFYNSSVLINPDGSYHVYRKVHLFDREKLFFQPGDKAFDVCVAKNGVTIGMMICFDWQFPEAARSLALAGAQIICHPANLVLPWCQEAMKLRSLENRVFSVTANRTGTEVNGNTKLSFTGCSQILSPLGEVLLRLSEDEEAAITIDIDVERALDKRITERNDAFKDRRPELYRL